MKGLNKENFFNDMQANYPDAFAHFSKWIDDYKKEVGWEKLFNGDIDIAYRTNDGAGAWDAGGVTKAPKFHNIPIEMQYGILSRYHAECQLKFSFGLRDRFCNASYSEDDCIESATVLFGKINMALTK